MKITLFPSIVLVLGLIAVALAYGHGLPGDFEFDDGINLFHNNRFVFKERSWENIVRASFSSDSGPLGRPVSMFSFALNQYLSGADPYWFKFTNIAIHLCNIGLVFIFCTLLMRTVLEKFDAGKQRWIPVAVAVIWGLMPFNLTSVLYIVQRMTSMSATFMLLSLCCYLLGRLQLVRGRPIHFWISLAGCAVFGCLAVFSKESALLLPLFFFLIELYFLRFKGADNQVSRLVLVINVVVAVAPVVLVTGYALLDPEWIVGGYSGRTFTLEERVLTEARVIWFYLRQILLPDIQGMGLFHDDFVVSTGLLDPPATLISLLGVALLALSAVLTRRCQPLLAFGLAWFLVGHLLESTVWPLELIHEHRNYLPSIGITLATVGVLTSVPESLNKLIWRGVLPAIALAYAGATYARALQWQNLTDHAISEAINHPNSSRANFQLARVYAKLLEATGEEHYFLKAKEAFERSIAVDRERRSGGYFGLIHLAFQAGKEADPLVVNDLVALLPHTSAIGLDLAFLGQLGRCQVDRACKLPDEQFEAIANAFLKNPKLSDGFRASVLSILGVYSANKKGDWQGAEQFFIEATRLASRADHWLSLGEYYRVVGQFDLARDAVARASLTGDAKRYTYEIEAAMANIERSGAEMQRAERGGKQ